MRDWNEEAIVFECCGEPLVGIVHRVARRESRLGVLIVVGGPQYRVGSHRQFTLMARALAANGFPVLRFDYRGMGDSGGEPRSFEAVSDDILAGLRAFRKELPELDGVILWGLCDAASAILMGAELLSQAAGLVLVNPWVRTPVGEARAYVRHYYLQRLLQRDFWRKMLSGDMDLRHVMRQCIGTLNRAARPATRSHQDGSTYIDRMLQGLCGFRGPVLVVLSGRDLTAREFEAIRRKSPEWDRALSAARVRWSCLERADHTFSDRVALHQGTQTTLNWIADTIGVAA